MLVLTSACDCVCAGARMQCHVTVSHGSAAFSAGNFALGDCMPLSVTQDLFAL